MQRWRKERSQLLHLDANARSRAAVGQPSAVVPAIWPEAIPSLADPALTEAAHKEKPQHSLWNPPCSVQQPYPNKSVSATELDTGPFGEIFAERSFHVVCVC